MSEPEDFVIGPDGIPLLTDLVTGKELRNGPDGEIRLSRLRISDIANDLLDSEVFQRQLDEIARELSGNIRLQMEQALGIALENVISEALENNKLRTFELVRRHLENALPGLLAKVAQDQGLAG